MTEIIYLVCGDVGEYSDHSSWTVAWYPTEDEAKAHVAALEEDNDAAATQLRDWDYDRPWGEREAIVATPLDPDRSDYCGSLPTYSVAKIERGKWPFPLPPRGDAPSASPVRLDDAGETR